MKKKIILIALAATMAFGATACEVSTDNDTEPTAKTGVVEKTKEKEATTTEVVAEGAVPLGNFIEKGNYKFSFVDAKQYDEIKDPENEFLDATPSEGKKYLVLFFEVENISSEKQNVNLFYYKAYLDDYDIDQETILVKPEGYEMLSGDLAPGKKLKGYVCYEVDPDWKKLEFTYTDGILDSDTTYDFVVTSDEVK